MEEEKGEAGQGRHLRLVDTHPRHSHKRLCDHFRYPLCQLYPRVLYLGTNSPINASLSQNQPQLSLGPPPPQRHNPSALIRTRLQIFTTPADDTFLMSSIIQLKNVTKGQAGAGRCEKILENLGVYSFFFLFQPGLCVLNLWILNFSSLSGTLIPLLFKSIIVYPFFFRLPFPLRSTYSSSNTGAIYTRRCILQEGFLVFIFYDLY